MFGNQYMLLYSTIIGKYNDVSISDLLCNIPTNSAIAFLSTMQIKGSNEKTGEDRHKPQVLSWIMQCDAINRIEIGTKLCSCEFFKEANFYFIDTPTILTLIDKLLLYGHHNCSDELKDIDYTNLFKAYLYCSELRIDSTKEHSALDRISPLNSIDDIVKITLPIDIKYNELHYPKNYGVEFIKMYKFLNFCKRSDLYKDDFNAFISSNNLASWDVYSYKLFQYVINARLNENPLFCFAEEDVVSDHFLDKWCIDTNIYFSMDDFTYIRRFPLLKISKNTYCIICLKFLYDKIYQGLLFEFTDNYGKFKSSIGMDFCEQVLFYEAIYPFIKSYNKYISGTAIDNTITGGVDYYARKGNNILLFEYKDLTTRADIKYSDNYEVINSKIFSEFVLGAKGNKTAAKGVTQLYNNIQKIQNGEYDDIDKILQDNVCNIYPIIVYHDCTYMCKGVNFIVNSKFRNLLVPNNNSLVKDVVMINIDTLIAYSDYFKSGQLDLLSLVQKYIADYTANDNNKIFPLDYYIRREAVNLGYKNQYPKEFHQFIQNLA